MSIRQENQELAEAYSKKEEELTQWQEIAKDQDKRLGKHKDTVSKKQKKVQKDKEKELIKLRNDLNSIKMREQNTNSIQQSQLNELVKKQNFMIQDLE